ncbi:putative Glutathione S-transferase 4 [Hypsibius exemplaris]|uniref:glutathione transferase n=1 Tax=Hypsibius exemplaris TaxID=2072580 RepID=A0A9X6RP23_HYPEX|nr:putative Glutathione S-transferase 4 [Hypsibius exemplaris]
MADAAPKYKLIYFNAPAKAEPLRWMFAYGGVPFEDFRIKERPQIVTGKPNPEWDELKQKLPFGVVPVLEVNGEYLGEGAAIARYLAPKCGLAGANEWETAQADGIVTFIENEKKSESREERIPLSAKHNQYDLARKTFVKKIEEQCTFLNGSRDNISPESKRQEFPCLVAAHRSWFVNFGTSNGSNIYSL